jgi:hypothetical protein
MIALRQITRQMTGEYRIFADAQINYSQLRQILLE